MHRRIVRPGPAQRCPGACSQARPRSSSGAHIIGTALALSSRTSASCSRAGSAEPTRATVAAGPGVDETGVRAEGTPCSARRGGRHSHPARLRGSPHSVGATAKPVRLPRQPGVDVSALRFALAPVSRCGIRCRMADAHALRAKDDLFQRGGSARSGQPQLRPVATSGRCVIAIHQRRSGSERGARASPASGADRFCESAAALRENGQPAGLRWRAERTGSASPGSCSRRCRRSSPLSRRS